MAYQPGSGLNNPQDRCIVAPATPGSVTDIRRLCEALPISDARIACEEAEAAKRRAKEAAARQADPRNAKLGQRLKQLEEAYKDLVMESVGPAASGVGAPMALGRQHRSDVPAMPSAHSRATTYGAWFDGYGDREWRDSRNALDDGGTADTVGLLGGAHHVFRRLFSPRDVFLLGVTAGYSETDIKFDGNGAKLHMDGPSIGLYGVFVHGQLGINFFSVWDFMNADFSELVVGGKSAEFRNFSAASNASYRILLGRGWVEPTVGIRYTETNWDNALSELDGNSLRVQGGLRIGTSFRTGSVIVSPSLTGLLYSNVDVHGYSVADAGFPVRPADEGRLFEQGILRLDFDFGGGMTSFIEGDVRHGDLSDGRDAVGVGGRVGVGYRW